MCICFMPRGAYQLVKTWTLRLCLVQSVNPRLKYKLLKSLPRILLCVSYCHTLDSETYFILTLCCPSRIAGFNNSVVQLFLCIIQLLNIISCAETFPPFTMASCFKVLDYFKGAYCIFSRHNAQHLQMTIGLKCVTCLMSPCTPTLSPQNKKRNPVMLTVVAFCTALD